MQVLTNDPQTGAKAYLVPSSMSAGNTVKNERTAAIEITAPGSASILPPSPTHDQVVEIPARTDEKIPVSFPGDRERVTPQDVGRDGAARWDLMDDVPAPSRWKQV